MGWIILLVMFILTALVTYGTFLNVEETKQEIRKEEMSTCGLSAKLNQELCAFPALQNYQVMDQQILQRFYQQEVEMAQSCENQGYYREAEIHQGLAVNAKRRLSQIRIA